MKRAIRKIDLALKRLYNLESGFRAEDFLVTSGSRDHHGALYFSHQPPADLSVGIYLDPKISQSLESFGRWPRDWNVEQLRAFTVAAEEISHFHYLLYHARAGRQLTHLEMELQGEIDKFLLTYFATGQSLESLLVKLFDEFRLAERLTADEKSRYLDANQFARRFILKCARHLAAKEGRERAFRILRRFWRLSHSEKISLIAA